MLDPEITKLADELIQIQFHERTQQLGRDLQRISDEMIKHGMTTSSPHVKAVYDVCARDVELRALIAWQNLQRVLSHAGVVLSEPLASDLKESYSKYADAILTEPKSHLDRL